MENDIPRWASSLILGFVYYIVTTSILHWYYNDTISVLESEPMRGLDRRLARPIAFWIRWLRGPSWAAGKTSPNTTVVASGQRPRLEEDNSKQKEWLPEGFLGAYIVPPHAIGLKWSTFKRAFNTQFEWFRIRPQKLVLNLRGCGSRFRTPPYVKACASWVLLVSL